MAVMAADKLVRNKRETCPGEEERTMTDWSKGGGPRAM